MEVRKDLLGKTPEIGDIITFNPPRYKGIILGEVYDFAKSGLPKVNILKQQFSGYRMAGDSPKTGFVIVKKR